MLDATTATRSIGVESRHDELVEINPSAPRKRLPLEHDANAPPAPA